ncbi:hypothetical protein OUZ56_029675 [Daphnia magna]|uniref:Reverse transcriptase n=1 Tax=Daphnia magna TaxID=35525 RepID=A0ABR0B7H7_9CRUS|nr:hypothetical protein OUZ56_029675 [Daphnia magna]
MASISVAWDAINTAAIESALRDIDEENKDKLLKHAIHTQEQGPIRQRANRTSLKQIETAKNIIKELMQNRMIRYSMFPWAAPIVLILPPDIDELSSRRNLKITQPS